MIDDRQSLIDNILVEEALSRKFAKASLSHFTEYFWPIIEPSTPYVHGWHIDAICEHLEACATFDIKRLIINMPPRHMKSILVNVMFPAWIWAKDASKRFVNASYSHSLSIRDGIKMRDVVESSLYRSTFEIDWQLRDDQNQKQRFENTRTGFRFSTSVGGTMTGEGGDYLVADDPLNAKEAHSEAAREECWGWWSGVMSTRANDPKRHARIIVMQRLHEDDLTGRLLERASDGEKYERLILPAEYSPKSTVMVQKTGLGWCDPRKIEGELLWPERFDAKALAELKLDLGSQASMSQLQQDPQPSEGGLFKEEWWPRLPAPPSTIESVVQFWDCAQKPGITNDYSVCATWLIGPDGYHIASVWREKTDGPRLEAMAKALYEEWRPIAVVIEDKSAGQSLIQYLRLDTTIPVIAYNPQGSKEVRATAATPTVEARKVSLPIDAPWVDNFIEEHKRFPNATNDDQVDTTSMAIDYLRKFRGAQPRIRRL